MLTKKPVATVTELLKTFPDKSPGKRINRIFRHPEYDAREIIDWIYTQVNFKKYLPLLHRMIARAPCMLSPEVFIYLYWTDHEHWGKDKVEVLREDSWNIYFYPWFTNLDLTDQVLTLQKILKEAMRLRPACGGVPFSKKIAELVGKLHFPKYQKKHTIARFVAELFQKLDRDLQPEVWHFVMSTLSEL